MPTAVDTNMSETWADGQVVGGSDASGWLDESWVLKHDRKGDWEEWLPGDPLTCPLSSCASLVLVQE